jgi:hypothetical protein
VTIDGKKQVVMRRSHTAREGRFQEVLVTKTAGW